MFNFISVKHFFYFKNYFLNGFSFNLSSLNRSDDPDSSGLPLSFPDQVQPSSVSVPPGGVAGARGDWPLA